VFIRYNPNGKIKLEGKEKDLPHLTNEVVLLEVLRDIQRRKDNFYKEY